MNKIYYQILGINENATVEEIKKAYKKKAMECHPDINPDLDNEDMIKEINIAYEKIMESKKNGSNENFSSTSATTSDFTTSTNDNAESIKSMWEKYKTCGIDFDINSLDSDCIFIGDIYVVKYKFELFYDEHASFKDQTYFKLKQKNVILLRIGFDRYVNLSRIKSSVDIERLKQNLKNREYRNQVTILGKFFKPFAGDLVALNVKSYYEIMFYENEKNTKTIKELTKIMNYKK